MTEHGTTASRTGPGWSIVAWALGAWAPAAAVWPPRFHTERPALLLLLTAALLVVVLAARTTPNAMTAVGLLATLVAGAAATTGSVGRAPVLLTAIFVAVAHAALVGWAPRPTWPRRAHPHAWVGAVLLLAATVTWRATRALPPTIVLAGLAATAVELTARVGLLARVDRGVDSVGRQAWTGMTVGARAATSALVRWTGAGAVARYLRGSVRSFGAWRRAPISTRDRWFMGAIGLGAVLRTVWVVAMTEPHAEFYSWWNLEAARQFAQLDMPSYGGLHTAYWPPGYGALIAPVHWVGDRTGWFEIHWAAAAVNVAVGTATIALVGFLASRWFGSGARNPAAWLMALATGQIYATAAAVPDLLSALLFLLVVLAATAVVDRADTALGPFVAIGALVGYATLVRDVALILVVIPALTIRARRGAWTATLRPTLAAFVGVALLLVPWAIRNGTQVGVWSPFSTVSSDTLCYTRYKLDWIEFLQKGPEIVPNSVVEECNRYSPLDNPDEIWAQVLPADRQLRNWGPDEPRWVRHQQREFLEFVVREPFYLLKMTPLRVYQTAGSDSQGGLALATESGEVKIAGPQAMEVYAALANAWYYAVLGLAVTTLIVRRRARRALPFLFLLGVLAIYTVPGPRALSRHYYSAYPFLVAIAAYGVASIRDAAAGSDTDAEPTIDEVSSRADR